jgi:adenylate kinase
MVFRLIFLGPPGAGKGTIAQRLSQKYGLQQISTGDLLRSEVEKGTELGKKVKAVIEKGELVDDETVAALVENRLRELGSDRGFILDGFPRTIKQASLLESAAKKLGLQLDAALDIEASDETIIERLSGRVQCTKCSKIYNLRSIPPKQEGKCDACNGKIVQREDDKPAVVKMRIATYRKKTAPLIEYYKKKRLLQVIDANADSPEKNLQNAEAALSKLKK